MYNSTSTPNYRDEPYDDLGMYVNEVQRLDRGFDSNLTLKRNVLAPGGRDLGKFSIFFRCWEGLVIHITR